ncbi:uncharacterized protein LOC18446203 isoform X3 [Amborella trichopoda]|uniref:uncharacterized protein LOC18446203 isoform X3 n=1 Tax=Amborella trichopoda TaxID=13333 RepID=UPI0005D43022|nr:uncharacterized protein LOC18446203 isoform X3 [Amborella trichopoda]|eukprot:XP_006856388.2 uncharacterized protein LOC18446203 isoform X3 [Amborella trichopoda]
MGNGDERKKKKKKESYGSPKNPDSLKHTLIKESSYKNQPSAYVIHGVGSNESIDSDLSMSFHCLDNDLCSLSERVTALKSTISSERHEVDLETTQETRKTKRKVAIAASSEWAATNDNAFASMVEDAKMFDVALDGMAMRVTMRASEKNAALDEALDQIASLRQSLEEANHQIEAEHTNALTAEAEVKELRLQLEVATAEALRAQAEPNGATSKIDEPKGQPSKEHCEVKEANLRTPEALRAQAEVKKALRKIGAAQAEASMALKEASRARKEAKEACHKREEARIEASRAEAAVKEMRYQLLGAQAEALRAQAEVKALQSQSEATQAEVLRAQAEAKDAYSQKQAAQAEVLAMKATDSTNQRQLEFARNRIIRLEAEKNALQYELKHQKLSPQTLGRPSFKNSTQLAKGELGHEGITSVYGDLKAPSLVQAPLSGHQGTGSSTSGLHGSALQPKDQAMQGINRTGGPYGSSTSSGDQGEKKKIIRIDESTKALSLWKLDRRQVELIRKTGLGSLMDIGVFNVDCKLLMAFIKTWCTQTNTAHLNIGEMGPTLYDVWRILHIPVTGEPVTGIRPENYRDFIKGYLGDCPTEKKLMRIKHTWLRKRFGQLPKGYSKLQLVQYTRAYLLYLVGTTIFADSSKGTTLAIYLQLFHDFDTAGKYAWGAAALAFLYRSLSKVVDGETVHFSGSATLLQCWIYEHFIALHPKPIQMNSRMARACAWVKQPRQKDPYKVFENLTVILVNWEPYEESQEEDYKTLNEINKETALCRSFLISFNIAEYYMPDRMLRQFGKAQGIPAEPLKWDRREKVGVHPTSWKDELSVEIRDWHERQHNIIEAVIDINGGLPTKEYMAWYNRFTP